MPLVLKRVLVENNISQMSWVESITKSDGTSMSISAGNLILNWSRWPALMAGNDIKKQTYDFLKRENLPASLINHSLWEMDEKPAVRKVDKTQKRKSQNGNSATSSENDTQMTLPEKDMLSQEAKRHFNLFKDPFINDVNSEEDVYLGADQRYVRSAMHYAASNAGFLAIVGESGAGKSTLRKDLLAQITRKDEQITIIQPKIIDKEKMSAGSICDAIIADLSNDLTKKIPRSLEAKARLIEKLLIGSSIAGNSHVLMVEEAHDMTIPVLKYLKRFWEIEQGYKHLLGIILVGQPELKKMLDVRTNYAAREVINRCEVAELRPLDNDLKAYLSLKFDRINKSLADVFEDDAYDAIRARLTFPSHNYREPVQSMLYPQWVNLTVTKCMNLAAQISSPKISAELVEGV